MLSEFAVNVLGNEPDEYLSCLFVDMYSEDEEMQYYAKRACQLGLMGLDGEGKPVHTFSPNEPMTVAQLGTVISRILR